MISVSNLHKDFAAHMQHDPHRSLPQPDADSAAHSQRVADWIHGKIGESGGSISFAEFMQHALYAPGLGYYAAGAAKFAAAGDFVTAPEVSAVFGRVLARQCAEVLAATDGGSILEFGAGSGKLAVDILCALQALDALPARYDIVEVSADLIERQQRRVREQLPQFASRVRWLTELPQAHVGVVIANEVLDALPVERFLRTETEVRQLRVTAADGRFCMIDAAAPAYLHDAVQRIEADLGGRLPPGFVSEVSHGLPGWLGDVAAAMHGGVAFLFDYGLSRREVYAAGRSGGWLRCHFRHHVHDNPLILAGIQDITAWVDFTTVAEAAVASGLDVIGYAPQAQFLLGGGLDLELQGFASLPTETQIELSGQVKMLTLPDEMGENFKCMALRRGDVPVPSAFQLADRTHTL
ncbi:MAG: SAM-dependent methyltransferase [Woeseiaceae bacterium]